MGRKITMGHHKRHGRFVDEDGGKGKRETATAHLTPAHPAVTMTGQRQGTCMAAVGTSLYRQENGVSLIEIRLNTIQQFFNSLDPSPFHEKDLDRDAELYIVEAVREMPLSAPVKLVLYVPPDELVAAQGAKIEDAIHNYFSYRLWAERAALRRELSYGRTALCIGLTFLFVCVILRQLVFSLGESALYQILAEGLLISGWVAMWRPIQVFLYDWWPIRRNCAFYAKLARLPTEVRARRG